MEVRVIPERAHDTFWSNPPAAEQARQQGVGPIESIDELSAPDLFTDEDIDAFLAVIFEVPHR